MKNLGRLFGIVAFAAIIAFIGAGCDLPEPGSEKDEERDAGEHVHDWGEWTPFIYPNAVLGGYEKRICKLDEDHYEVRRVERPADSTVIPENFSAKDRWTKEIDIPVTATLEYSVDNEGVCAVTVSNATSTTRWTTNVHYYYSAKKNKAFKYEFEAWTVGGERTLSVQCYYDFDTQESVMANDITINSTRQTYTVYGGTLPDGGIRSFQFLCANQTGTFYVKINSITEYTLDQLPVASRWSKAVDPGSTVDLEYVVGSDDVCTITLTGAAMNNSNGDWNAWRARANYLFEAQANTHYEFEIEAWTENGNPNHWLDVQYYYDEATQIFYDAGCTITPTQQTHTVSTNASQPIIKGGIRELRFQVADFVGIIHIKIVSITEYTPIPPEATGELIINNFPSADTGAWFGGYAYNYDNASGWDGEGNWVPINPIDPADQIRLNFEYKWGGRVGNTITFEVYKDGEHGNEAFTGNLTVPEYRLTIDSWGDNSSTTKITNAFYQNTQPITFINGSATIDFNTQMKIFYINEWVSSRKLTITNIDQNLINQINGAESVRGYVFLGTEGEYLLFNEPQLSGTTATFRVDYEKTSYSSSLPTTLTVQANNLSITVDTGDHYTVYTNTQPVTFTSGVGTIAFTNMQVSDQGDYGGGGENGDGGNNGGGGPVGPGGDGGDVSKG